MSAIASMYVSHFRVIAIVCIPQNLAGSDIRVKSKEGSLHQQLQINTCHCFPAGGMLPTLTPLIRSKREYESFGGGQASGRRTPRADVVSGHEEFILWTFTQNPILSLVYFYSQLRILQQPL